VDGDQPGEDLLLEEGEVKGRDIDAELELSDIATLASPPYRHIIYTYIDILYSLTASSGLLFRCSCLILCIFSSVTFFMSCIIPQPTLNDASNLLCMHHQGLAMYDVPVCYTILRYPLFSYTLTIAKVKVRAIPESRIYEGFFYNDFSRH